jgi:hypothetical protein
VDEVITLSPDGSLRDLAPTFRARGYSHLDSRLVTHDSRLLTQDSQPSSRDDRDASTPA